MSSKDRENKDNVLEESSPQYLEFISEFSDFVDRNLQLIRFSISALFGVVAFRVIKNSKFLYREDQLGKVRYPKINISNKSATYSSKSRPPGYLRQLLNGYSYRKGFLSISPLDAGSGVPKLRAMFHHEPLGYRVIPLKLWTDIKLRPAYVHGKHGISVGFWPFNIPEERHKEVYQMFKLVRNQLSKSASNEDTILLKVKFMPLLPSTDCKEVVGLVKLPFWNSVRIWWKNLFMPQKSYAHSFNATISKLKFGVLYDQYYDPNNPFLRKLMKKV